MNVTEKDLEKIMEENQELGRHGFGKGKYGSDEFEKGEEILFDEFRKCVEWMQKNLTISGSNCKLECGSYQIKHLVEQDFGEYIPNGAPIAAAIFLNIPYEISDGKNVNFRTKINVDQTRF